MSLGRSRSFEAPRQSRRQEPQESIPSRPPARDRRETGAGLVLEHPEDQAKDATRVRAQGRGGQGLPPRGGTIAGAARRRSPRRVRRPCCPHGHAFTGEHGRRAHPRLREVAPRAVREARAHARGDRAGHEGPEHRSGATLWRGAPRGEQRPSSRRETDAGRNGFAHGARLRGRGSWRAPGEPGERTRGRRGGAAARLR